MKVLLTVVIIVGLTAVGMEVLFGLRKRTKRFPSSNYDDSNRPQDILLTEENKMKRLIRVMIATNIGAILCMGILPLTVFIAAFSDNDKDLVKKDEPLPGRRTDCPDFPTPNHLKSEYDGNIATFLFEIPYSQDPAGCFPPFPKEEGRFAAGWTRITVGDEAPIINVNTWVVYDPPTVREWDGNNILVGDIIDLKRMGPDFLSLWAEYEYKTDILTIKMHIEDLAGNSFTVEYGDCSKQGENNA
jgi:hypothetical protein